MKMIHIYRTVLVVIFVMILPACRKSFLEVTPKGRLITSKTSDYDLSLNSLALLNMETNAQVPLGDEVAAMQPYFEASSLRTQRLFRYEDIIYEPNQDAPETVVPMQNLYLYNKIINEVMSSEQGTEVQKRSIQAEAMFGRAWTYFLLINYYGKPYNDATAVQDPGYPIVTTADVTNNQYTRASVKQVYDFILNDLTTALPNLPVQTVHRLRASRAACEGLLAKVYVHMQRYREAIPLLDAAIADIANATIPVSLYDYNQTFATGGAFMPIDPRFGPSYPTVPNNWEIIFGKQAYNPWASSNNEIIITAQTAALYSAGDLRRNFYATVPYPSGVPYSNGMLRGSGPGRLLLGVNVPELYLFRAECKTRLNDLGGAQADLETFRKRRMPPAAAAVPPEIASKQLPLLQFVFEERLREYALQGERWFDMRRLSVDPLFQGITFAHAMYSETGSVIATYTLRPERLTLRIPQKLINQNPGMPNNP